MSTKRPVLKIQYDSPVILTFALLSLLALGLNWITGGTTNTLIFSVYRSSFSDPLTYLRFFLHVLGHTDIVHYFSNICLLLVLGPIVESRYKSKNVLISIIVTALISGIIHFAFFEGTALLGASGIVFMMIFLSSISGIRGGNIPLSLILVAIIYLGQEIYSMFFGTNNISELTHIIGGICGIICGTVILKTKNR